METSSLDKLENTLSAGEVRRFHCAPGVAPQPVGLHAYGVVVISSYINAGIGTCDIFAALLHDMTELVTGDMPAPFKCHLADAHEGFMDRLENHVSNRFFSPVDFSNYPKLRAVIEIADIIECLRWTFKNEREPQKVNRSTRKRAIDYLNVHRDEFSNGEADTISKLINMYSWEEA